MMFSDHCDNSDGLYLRLEVSPTASHDEIVRAYRRLAHGAHPDAHPGDPEAPRRFRELTEAYEVLGNPARRERYDRARRQAYARTGQAEATAEHPAGPRPGPRPGPLFSSPTWGGPPVSLGTRPVAWPLPGLVAGPALVRPSTPQQQPAPHVEEAHVEEAHVEEAHVEEDGAGEEDATAELLARLVADIFGPRWRA